MGLLSAGASILGGALNRSGEARAARRAHAYNKEFVQNQIQWRVQDATKAGIHPLVAMGASLTGGNAVPVGGTATGDSIRDAGTAVTAGLARAKANKRADRLADAEVELAEAQALEAKARAKSYSDITSQQAGDSAVQRYLKEANQGGNQSASDEVKEQILSVVGGKDKNNVTDIGARFNFIDAITNPSNYNADMVSQEKGEPAEWAYSVAEIISDIGKWLERKDNQIKSKKTKPSRWLKKLKRAFQSNQTVRKRR